MELLQPRMSSEQSETQITPLIRNAVYLVSQSPKANPALGLLNLNKVDDVAPANQVFSVFFFLVLYCLSCKSVLSPAQFAVLQMETVHFMKCLFVSPKRFIF